MRALNKGWIGIALIILFGASLFFFRGSSRYSNLFNSDNFVANVSGTQISRTQFLRSLEMNIGQFAQMIGQDLSGDEIRAFQIHELVLQNLVNNAIFENEFDNLNYVLDDTTIAKQTKKRFPNLYLNNKINDEALNTFLRQQRLKIEDLVNIVNYETRAAVFDDLFFKKNYPYALSKKINLYDNQTREINLLKIPYDEIIVSNLNKENLNKDNQELIKFFQENSNNYMTKEKRDISYILIEKSSYEKSFTPNETEVINYFNENKDLFDIPEKRDFKQFNFKSKDEAEKFRVEITGLSTDEILKIVSKNNIQYNEFKDVNSNQVLDELSEVIFSLNAGEISGVVTTTLAHHIIILDKINKKREASLDEVKDKIKDTIKNIELDNFFNEFKVRLNQQILNGYSLNELATENNFEINNFKSISKEIINKSDLEIAILNASFSQNKDFVSDIVDFDENVSFISYVDNIYPSKTKNIDEAYDNLIDDFIKTKKIDYANKVFENNKNNNLIKINDVFNSNIEKQNVKLNSNYLPNSLIKNIFDTDLNQMTFSLDEENIYFAEIINIKIPSKMEISKDINLISEFKNAFGNEIIKTKKISINDELINGLLSQYK